MKKIKKYNETTQEWELLYIIEGKQGEKGDNYILTDEDKQEIAALVEGEFVQCSEVTRIAIVDSLPAVEEDGVLYLVKE